MILLQLTWLSWLTCGSVQLPTMEFPPLLSMNMTILNDSLIRFDLIQAIDIALYVPLIVSTKMICGTM